MQLLRQFLKKSVILGLLLLPLLCHAAQKEYAKEEVTLFCSSTCPPCQKVLEYLRQIDRSVTVRNVMESQENFDALMRLGGKAQVPCLAVDNMAIYDSNSIINWLSQNKEGLPSYKAKIVRETPKEEPAHFHHRQQHDTCNSTEEKPAHQQSLARKTKIQEAEERYKAKIEEDRKARIEAEKRKKKK